MQVPRGGGHCSNNPSLPQFEEYIALLAAIGDHEKLFPKQCRSCERRFRSLGEYLNLTAPKGHVFEDGSKVMKRPFTMIYRHCACGNTLVLTLTSEIFPESERFWSMIARVAEESNLPPAAVAARFSSECDRFFAPEEDHGA